MKICVHCGCPAEDSAKICMHCGCLIPPDAPQYEMPVQSSNPPQSDGSFVQNQPFFKPTEVPTPANPAPQPTSAENTEPILAPPVKEKKTKKKRISIKKILSRIWNGVKRHKILSISIASLVVLCLVGFSVLALVRSSQADGIQEDLAGKYYQRDYVVNNASYYTDIWHFQENGYCKLSIRYRDETRKVPEYVYGSLNDIKYSGNPFDVSLWGDITFDGRPVELDDSGNIIDYQGGKTYTSQTITPISAENALAFEEKTLRMELLVDASTHPCNSTVGIDGFLDRLVDALEPPSSEYNPDPFIPEETIQESPIPLFGHTIDRYVIKSPRVSYILYVEQDSGYAIAAEMIIGVDTVLFLNRSIGSMLNNAINGVICATHVPMSTYTEVLDTIDKWVMDTPYFHEDCGCLYHGYSQGDYYLISVTNVKALGLNKDNYWSPIQDEEIWKNALPEIEPEPEPTPTCAQCHRAEPYVVFWDEWKEGDICIACQAENAKETTPTPPKPTNSVPYITNIAGSVGIYQKPDWNSGFVQYVGASGLYTIVEEAYDSSGNLWGRLKSGAGWVILSEGKQQADQSPQVTAQYADQSILNSGNYHHCIADSTEYAVSVVFRTNISLTNVSLFYVNDVFSFTPGPEAFHIDYWDPGMPFVAEISFPGDMSTFGLRFTDSTGITYTYALSTSGQDGSLKFYKVS